MNARTLIAALVLTIVAIAAPALAQSLPTRWTPWLGCWDVVQDTASENLPGASINTEDAAPRVCVSSAGHDAVTLTTTVAGEPAFEETLIADGAEHPTADDNCEGRRTAEWSRDGRRLFTHATLTCANEAARTVSGLALMMPGGIWLDVQEVQRDNLEHVRVRRYRRTLTADDRTRLSGGRVWTLERIAEASQHVPSGVLEAALIETRAGFDLTGQALIGLADAGVPSSILDLIVALSYPEDFIVERATRAGAQAAVLQREGPTDRAAGYATAYYAPFGFYDLAYSGYYYSPYSYSYYSPYYYYSPLYVVPGSDGGSPGADDPQPSGAGRVVNGLGYTRVRPREAIPAEPSSGRERSRSRGRSPSGSSSPGTDSTTAASPQGDSGGSSSGRQGGSGRTAQPR